MTYWALKPYSSLTDLSGTFNLSSINSFMNLISVFYFIVLTIFRNSLPQGKQSLFYIYSLVFFVLFSFLMNEDLIPGGKPRHQPVGKVFDFSDTKSDSEILSFS